MSRVTSRYALMVWPVAGSKTQKKYVKKTLPMFEGTFTGTDMKFAKELTDMPRSTLFHSPKHADAMREIIEGQGKFHCRVVESRLIYSAPERQEIELEPGTVTHPPGADIGY